MIQEFLKKEKFILGDNHSWNKMKPKIVLVGSGRFGNNHLRNLIELDKKRIIEFVGVSEIDKKKLKDIQKTYQLKTSQNYFDFIEEADAFDVVTPAFTHYDIVKKLLSQKKHVFVEKPLALTFNDATKLSRLAKKNKVTLQVGLIFRYNKAIDYLKKLIRQKDNYPYFVTGSFLQSTEPKKDVGAIFNYLHHFDILENLFGDKIHSVYSQANLVTNSRLETNVTVLIEYKNNLKVNLNLGWIPAGKFRTLELFSKKKHVKCDLMNQEIEITPNKGTTKSIKFHFSEPLNLELKDFVNCISTKKPPKANGIVGAKVIKVAEFATKSFQKEKVIKIN